ncbi:MAG: hypothetical protein EOO93_03300 [Pedobacter sp.]|nr:MAG: hypothetical protein EOO93_03300 [Pedobacter sp.]
MSSFRGKRSGEKSSKELNC